MADGTLLSHLADRFVTQRENLATEALAYLLADPSVAEALDVHVHRYSAGIGVLRRFETQKSATDDTGIPDLVGVDDSGRPTTLIEAKFAAALTANQPVTYMKRLAEIGEPALLLFLVPQRRVAAVWAEVQHRCEVAGLVLTDTTGREPSAQWGDVTVGVTTWDSLLGEIEARLDPSERRVQLAELAQLRGLCERDARESFVPLTSDELGGTIGKRLLDLDSLITECVSVLQSEGLADLSGLKWSSGQGWFGRYLRFGDWTCLFHVNFDRWGKQRPTPLWLRVLEPDLAVSDALAPLAARAPSRVLNTDGRTLIPIMLPVGVERDQVLADIDEQLREVHRLLTRVSPVGPASDLAAAEQDHH